MNHPGSFYKNHLTPNHLDRLSGQNLGAKSISDLFKLGNIKIIPVLEDKVYINKSDFSSLTTLTISEIGDIQKMQDNLILLGKNGKDIFFALDLSGNLELKDQIGFEEKDFQNIRWIGPLLPSNVCGMLTYASSLIYWKTQINFCSKCGTKTRQKDFGRVIVCTNANCQKNYFPNTDPAVIVLVEHEDKALLGRQYGWPEKMYSTLAGFVEPGERIEDTVRREVFEESGVNVKNINYYDSQPWPFPASLMLGFFAEAESTEINIDNDELQDCLWFTRFDFKNGLKENSLLLPSKISIAYRLIEEWFNKGSEAELHTLLQKE